MEPKKLTELKTLLAEANDLDSAVSVLYWDQATFMPPGGGNARGRQLATLARLHQQKSTNPKIGRLLDGLRSYEESLPFESDDASLIRVARRLYERAVKVPPAFMGRLYQHNAQTFQAWAEARPANDFARVAPYLEKTLDLSREYANFFPGYEHIADPLIEAVEYGMKATSVRTLFGELRRELTPLVHKIAAQPRADDSCLRKVFPISQQAAFGEAVARRIGYDFERGRLDITHHPFTISFAPGDVRITTRYSEAFLSDSLFSTIHEAGHALYEQGVNPAFEATPLGNGTSSGVHESQSRLWENQVGHSRHFWRYFYPQLQAAFPQQLADVPLEAFYSAINKVEPSLVRVDADEVTYNLHIMIRFDLELALLEGTLSIRELPEAWNARYQADLGITPPDDRLGVMQDAHWYDGMIGGAFQSYTIGNILSAQYLQAALRAHPEIPDEMEQGEFATLLGWLRKNLYQHGRKFTASELTERVTGRGIDIAPYMRYLREKYGELYKVE